ncbi:siderophore-interacting protein [Paradevosia shaoguanensis]|uniref:siderophore-interacting protein n=1 Tax=Paradevosia shaoguanensis TaxID=1335043 RepID=UPI003C7966F8
MSLAPENRLRHNLTMDIKNLLPSRVRHDIRVRKLTVAAITDITPLMRRITLAGDQLEAFTSPGFDDHIKMFFPPEGEPFPETRLGPDGLVFEGQRPPMRDYTPRRYDAENRTLDIDFVLHGDGPAASWAARVKVGDPALIAGPRGSMIVPDGFDWHLLAGDETALPAIGRRLEELRPGAKALVVIEVASAAEEQTLITAADAQIQWVHRNGAPAGTTGILAEALARLTLPEGRGFAYVAGEARLGREAKKLLLEERGLPPELVKIAGYWALGEADAHLPH